MKKNIVIFLCLSFAAFMRAQTDTCSASLSGKVVDEHDGSVLEFASVFIIELNKGTVTDAQGNFSIKQICNGQYHVKISHIGCVSLIKSIQIQGHTVQHFFPEHHTELLNEINILTKKAEEIPTQNKSELSVEKLNQSKGYALGEALKTITGVTSLNTGNSISKPIIHGMHSNRILILNNGIRQEGQQWGVEHAPEIDPFIANKIAVIKGANAVRYGSDAIAGVILLEPKPLPDTACMKGELNLIGMSNGQAGTASGFLEGNFEKIKALSWRIQGTLKQSGTVHAPGYNLINTGLKEQHFSYSLAWKKQGYGVEIFYSQFNTSLGIFGASHIGNLTDLQSAFTSSVPLETGPFTYRIDRPFQQIEHELFKLNAFVSTGEAGQLKFVYARQYNMRNEYDKHLPLNSNLANLSKAELQYEITSHTGDLIWEHSTYKHTQGSLGISGLMQANTFEGRMLVPNFKNYGLGAFFIERWKKNKLELEAGLRYDYRHLQVFKYEDISIGTKQWISPIHEFKNLSSSIGSIYKADSSLTISFNLGTAWRAPSVNELYSNGLHHGAAALEFGNNQLQLEKAYTGVFTLNYQLAKKVYIEVSPYYNYITNFIYRQPSNQTVLTIRGAFPSFNYTQTNAILKGCDLTARYIWFKHIELTQKASILRAWNVTEKNWLIMMPSDRYETELTYRFKPHKKIKSAYLSSSFLFVTKQWRVPLNSDFVAPPAAYYLFNVHASSTLKVKNQELELGLSVLNLFNTSYRDYLDRFRYFADGLGRSINLRLKIPFNIPIKKTHFQHEN